LHVAAARQRFRHLAVTDSNETGTINLYLDCSGSHSHMRPVEALAEVTAPMEAAVSAHTRTVFDTDLHDLAEMVTEMGRIAEQRVALVFDALTEQIIELGDPFSLCEAALDALQRKIEEKSVYIITQRQPLAIDLRETISALHISKDIERVGYLATDISRRAVAIRHDDLPMAIIAGLGHMTKMVHEQVKLALSSYASRDINTALTVWNGDQQIDAFNNVIFHETLVYMSKAPNRIGACTQILFCVKNLERAGDHATNIAETVHYIVTGHVPSCERPKVNTTRFEKLLP
jgi:phosphate transport system protein